MESLAVTAVSAVVSADEQVAYLVTDTAYYDAAGIVTQLRSKVTVSPSLRIAIAGSGCVDLNDVARACETSATTEEALRRLPAITSAIRDRNDRGNPTGRINGHNDLMLFAAMWSDQRQRAEAWVVASSQAYLGSQYTPFTLAAIMALSSPPVADDVFAAGVTASAAATALREQRAWSLANDGLCFVGGWGELTSVGAGGIDQEKVATWPDRIGRPIATAG
ncbi:hypothetical protein COA17_07340 [Sphingomonas ginsenosidimutans]|uniref:Uncharacterized protein n=1 Tax=Sphingomonas ginsenosidimutans TaxID=862134 RepID=A0A2A4HZ87_9SPHN|nr:hypothetical protein [Sphingomonas ginsenosidimutans]PCG09664.1 hypothetical protein COA17_07340 [Sphingomonas ginsenosidimutans]